VLHCSGRRLCLGVAVDSSRFDLLTRRVGSRRKLTLSIGAASLLKLTDAAVARKKNRKNCKRKAIKICGGNTCGKRKNNCGKTFNCKCRGGQICLPNGSCGLACPTECPQEPFACACATGSDQVCVQSSLSCEVTAKSCASIADCPIRTACVDTECGPGGATEKRCVPVCHPAP
jgi:hypothetical protein